LSLFAVSFFSFFLFFRLHPKSRWRTLFSIHPEVLVRLDGGHDGGLEKREAKKNGLEKKSGIGETVRERERGGGE